MAAGRRASVVVEVRIWDAETGLPAPGDPAESTPSADEADAALAASRKFHFELEAPEPGAPLTGTEELLRTLEHALATYDASAAPQPLEGPARWALGPARAGDAAQGFDLDALLRGDFEEPGTEPAGATPRGTGSDSGRTPRKAHKRRWRDRSLAVRLAPIVVLAAAVGVGSVAWEHRRSQAVTARPAPGAPAVARLDPSATRTLEVASVPSGATVTVDGIEARGRTPLTVAGMRNDRPVVVRVTRAGYRDFARTLPAAAATPERLVAALEPGPGILTIRSDPSGASVSIGGRPVGRTPVTVGELETTGHHLIELAAPGHATAALRVGPGDRWRSEGAVRRLKLQVPLKRTRLARHVPAAASPAAPQAPPAPSPGVPAAAAAFATAPAPPDDAVSSNAARPAEAPPRGSAAAGIKQPPWAASP